MNANYNGDPAISALTDNRALDQLFACPACHAGLHILADQTLHCQAEGYFFQQVDGIWRFLLSTRQEYYQQFIQEYEAIRRAEGRGSEQAAYYLALPWCDLNGRDQAGWAIRAHSFQALLESVIHPLEDAGGEPLSILDAGAGNGWLSYQMARRGHRLVALDLLTNRFDGLGAHVHYDVNFIPVQGEFDHLPFLDQRFDLLVYNASLHYAVEYEKVILEGLRILKAGGTIVIMDTPVYRDGSSGARMVQAREAQFTCQHGFPSNSLPSQNYLTHDHLNDLAAKFSLSCRLLTPGYGLRWRLRPVMARLLGRREPARFHLILLREHSVGGAIESER
ncbi:MAG TPA: class I SAM-dependent methyltransferase [Anaerolineales bacterium]|nr:class I SAM-dependent methyltransferase [Anaerolineales bacterium]